jgi:hypothetical protein
LTRGSDWVAGLWAALAFLAGGWPPLVIIGLALIVIGKANASFSRALLIPPLVTAILWSAVTISMASADVWAAALTLPLTQKPSWWLGLGVVALGLPWSPFVVLFLSRSLRDGWNPAGRAWVTGWLQVAAACLIAGTLIPGVSQAARVAALAGLLAGTAACLEAAWSKTQSSATLRGFFILFSGVLVLWLIVVFYGCYLWNLAMPYYRALGVTMGVMALAAAALGWSALSTCNARRGLMTLVLVAIGMKLVHWGFYEPEWSYRYRQGPWGRAIGQWVPRSWPVYTIHEWPADLAFFIGRPVRQVLSPRFLNYLPGSESRYVLLQTSEFDNWPAHAPPISLVARFQDQSGSERILARTGGILPIPGRTVKSDSRP